MTSWRYETPAFDVGDPLVCRTLTLRPALWGVVFNELQRLGEERDWLQVDPTHATADEVIAEINKATDEAVFSGCGMIGQILELALETVPGWLLPCDGASYLDVDYPELGAVIHSNLREGPDGFRVPDRAGRFALGGIPVGDQGGESEHTLTIAEMPSHDHSQQNPGAIVVTPGIDPLIYALADPGLPGSTGSTGGGDPHNNMPPYEGTQFYIVAAYP